MVKVLAMALIIRELFKGRGGAGPGYYVMTPYFMGRLTHWISGGRVLLNEETINWLATRHDEITERALTLIVNTLMGGITGDYEHLRDVLRPWINHGTVNLGISTRDDAIKYIVGYYGGEVRREFAGLDDKCWGTLVLLLGIAWSGYAIRDLGSTANDLMPLVRPAVEFLSDAGRVNECVALKLLMVNNEITPLTEILLVGPVMGYTSPVLDALAKGRSVNVERDLGEFIRVIEDGRERNRGLGLAEGFYALGLVVLTAYA
ncbi:hypothetical protein [Vulcanisaeta sp. JCM 16159]|uniref:hypothetical protein n=1 Tax=Vulcanisaeta sp. JCM 16159 TaxID=1295371 RepID=UPI0006D1455B|nr:hypothetical protein [Vulcanisaeta sp. JCM 16159]